MGSLHDPFLNMGVIMALLHSEGIDPCFVEAEKRINKLGASSSAIDLRSGSPSGLAALDGSRSLKILLILALFSSIGGILGKYCACVAFHKLKK